MLLNIEWNRLYCNQPRARAFAKRRIRYHYFKKRLGSRGLRFASVRFVFFFFWLWVFIQRIDLILVDQLGGMVKVAPCKAVAI